jgi:murein DD-endopeptidase MepM/ murein hydrolase activator NlpD
MLAAALTLSSCGDVGGAPAATGTPTKTAGPSVTPSPSPTPSNTPTPTFPADAVVDVEALNLRAGPAVAHPILGGIGESTPVAIKGRDHDGEWLSVRLPDERVGWINSRFVVLRREYGTIPTVPTPTPPPTPTYTPEPIDPAEPIVLAPPKVAQGDPFMIRVRAPGASQVVAAISDRSYPLFPAGQDTFAAVLGVDVETSPGDQTVHLTIVDSGGSAAPSVVQLEVRDGLFREETIELDEQIGETLNEEARRQELEMLQGVWSHVIADRHWQGLWSPPVTSTVSSPFGTKRTYAAIDTTGRHTGMDFRGAPETSVHAPARGRVAFVGELVVRGNTVWIDHGWGVYSGYFHLTEAVVEQDTMVEPGDVLGTIGATGMTTGPHLHWEIRTHGLPVQPLQWLISDVGAIP